MPLDFKHRYVYIDEFTLEGIYYVNVKISYRGKYFFGKFVFCKKNIAYFENQIKDNVKPLGIKNNLNDVVIIEISNITYLKDTTIK